MCLRLSHVFHRAGHRFVGLLGRIHGGALATSSINLLGVQCVPSFSPSSSRNCVALAARGTVTSTVGSRGLGTVSGPRCAFATGVRNSFPSEGCPARLSLGLGIKTGIVFVTGSGIIPHHCCGNGVKCITSVSSSAI